MRRPTGATGRLARFGFTDVTAAGAWLGADGLALWDEARQHPADDHAAEVLRALAASADPDLALRQLHRLAESARRVPGHRAPGPIEAMRADPDLRARLAAVLGASATLGDDLAADPRRWTTLTAAAGTDTDPFAGASTDSPSALRSAHRCAMLRIAAADLIGEADLERTMDRLSRLADATLATALRLAQAEHRATPRLAVVAMGKCGGRELNYVSDVDVIFVCAGRTTSPTRRRSRRG